MAAILPNTTFGVQVVQAGGSGTSAAYTYSPSPADGDFLVLSLELGSTSTIGAAPTGWTLRANPTSASGQLAVFTRFWHTGDPASATFTWTTSSNYGLCVTAWSSVDASTSMDVTPTTNASTASPITTSITTVTPWTRLLYFVGCFGQTPSTPPECAALISFTAGSPSGGATMGGTSAHGVAFATYLGPGTVSLSSTHISTPSTVTVIIALRPADGGASSPGRSWYVRSDGSNSNTGTASSAGSAWQTLTQLLATAHTGLLAPMGGDTAYIAPTTYRETLTVTLTTLSTFTVVGDVAAAQFSDLAGGDVKWSAYTTNDTTAPSNIPLNLNGKSNLTFTDIRVISGAQRTVDARTTTSQHLTFQRCSLLGDSILIDLAVASQVNADWLFDSCWLVTHGNSGAPGVSITGTLNATADYDVGVILQNCVLEGVNGTSNFGVQVQNSGSGAFKGGGVLLRRCTFVGWSGGQVTAQNSWTQTYPLRAYGNLHLFASLNGAYSGTATNGLIFEDGNFKASGNTNTLVGGASQTVPTYAPLVEYGHAALHGRTPRTRYEPSVGSPVLGFTSFHDIHLKMAGSGADDATVGTVSWTSPTNVTASDDNRAMASALPALTGVSHYLVTSSHGFAVPSDATIVGVRVEAEYSQSAATLTFNSVKLVKGGVISGTDRASDVTGTWTTTDQWGQFGGYNSLWGVALTPSDVNASNFGVALSAKNTHATLTGDARIDAVRIAVYYTRPTPEVATDLLGRPRPAGGSVNLAAGALERGNTGRLETSTTHSGSRGSALDGPGYQDRDLDVDTTSTTVSVYLRYNSSYTGTLPQLQVVNGAECGVADATVTMTAAANTWQQVSIGPFAPSRTGRLTLRVLSNTTTAAGITYFDDYGVA